MIDKPEKTPRFAGEANDEIVASMPGRNQVVWNGFASPGLYNVYVKGMGWDAKRQVVVWG